MRSHLALFSFSLILLIGAACSDNTTPNPPHDSAPPDIIQGEGAIPDQAPRDGAKTDLRPDGGITHDLPRDDVVIAPDHPLPSDLSPDTTPDTLAHDAGPNSPGRCATAPLLSLINDTLTVENDITHYSNEFSTGCRTGTISTTKMNGPQAYYQILGV
ncbi:MAG: hypothetical protein KAI47_26045, partial [Deltaproteobacteria bacterium]|nr:hypothetical protein [Deltaproteobacteria bacterium]